jgi:hypothetical protein
MPYINDATENDNLSKQGILVNSDIMYRCPDDLSIRQPDPGGDGVWNRTSYLLNSQLSHKTRRYGRWTLLRFINEVGTSNFIAYVERNAEGLAATGSDPKQDDFDIWLGTVNIQPWATVHRVQQGLLRSRGSESGPPTTSEPVSHTKSRCSAANCPSIRISDRASRMPSS